MRKVLVNGVYAHGIKWIYKSWEVFLKRIKGISKRLFALVQLCCVYAFKKAIQTCRKAIWKASFSF